MGLPRQLIEANEEADAQIAEEQAQQQAKTAPDTSDFEETDADLIDEADDSQQSTSDNSAVLTDDDKTWKARYLTLKGMFEPQIAEQKKLVAEANNQRTFLLRQVADLQAQIREQATTPPPAQTAPSKDMDEIYESMHGFFGVDGVDALKQLLAAQQASTEGRISAITKQVTESAAETAQRQFATTFGNAVNDWEAINASDEFNAFLDEYEPVAGKTRRECLIEANKAHDAERCIAIFNAHKRNIRGTTTGHTKLPLEKRVAPGASQVGQTAPVEAGILFVADFAKATTAYTQGRMTKTEYQKLDREYTLAEKEGRLR